MAVGGDILEIAYKHPTIESGVWYPVASEDSTFDLGGVRTTDDDNGVDGGGRIIKEMMNKRWSFEGTISWDANLSNELDKATLLAADPVDTEFTVTSINGTVWSGTGTVVGDVKGSGKTARMSLKLAGAGKMKKISG
jgi:hypothetical protein